jgi:RNA polymerase sigma factor (TIGR02999 family)
LSSGSPKPVTELLVRWLCGGESALQDLIPLVYEELRSLARHYLEAEQNHDMLQSTALVHEAYLRLVDHSPSAIEGRAHFFGIAAHLMRQILADHARAGKQPRAAEDPASPWMSLSLCLKRRASMS